MDTELERAEDIAERLRREGIEAEKRRVEREKLAEQEERERKRQEGETAKIIQLNHWPEGARGVPNGVLRGSLFAAIQERYAKHVQRAILHDTNSLRIVYTGVRLTQSDLDVWEYALHLARKQCLGHKIYFTARSFLKGLGRDTGKSQHEWFKRVIARLGATTVEITHNDQTYMGSLLDQGLKDEKTGKYYIEINPMIARLYDAGHTYINWYERQLLGNKRPLAQWLHGYISSHDRWVPHKVETLREYSGSATKEIWKFKQQLKTALELLVSKNLIKSYSIDSTNLVNIVMNP